MHCAPLLSESDTLSVPHTRMTKNKIHVMLTVGVSAHYVGLSWSVPSSGPGEHVYIYGCYFQVWKDASLGQLLIPAVSIGPSTTSTMEITHFWSW